MPRCLATATGFCRGAIGVRDASALRAVLRRAGLWCDRHDQDSLRTLGAALNAAPYKAPPSAPVLYIKPYNTHVGHAATVILPVGADRIEVLGALGIVFGAQATRLAEADALGPVRGYTVVTDLSLPHQSLHRPPIRETLRRVLCHRPVGG